MSRDPDPSIESSLDRIAESLASLAESHAKVVEFLTAPPQLIIPTDRPTYGDDPTYGAKEPSKFNGIPRPAQRVNSEQSIKDLAMEHRRGEIHTGRPEAGHRVAVMSFPPGHANPMWKAFCLESQCAFYIDPEAITANNTDHIEYNLGGGWTSSKETHPIDPSALCGDCKHQRAGHYAGGSNWCTRSACGCREFVDPRKEPVPPNGEACITCKGSGEGLNLGGGKSDCRVCRGTGVKQPAPYPLVEHDPKDRCRHPDCKDTNWQGTDRLHLRSSTCPPDDDISHSSWSFGKDFPGWVAVGDDWDRAHYLPHPTQTTQTKEPQ